MDVIIVCHTEFGRVKGRNVIYDKGARQGVAVGVRALAELASQYGAKVTFAVMPEVAGYFPANIDHEIALHVHPGWEEFRLNGDRYDVGDTYLREHCKMSSCSTVLRDYTYAEQLGMIRAGKDLLKDTLGADVKTFVAGRWSINNDTVKALVNEGFTHECSALPHKKRGHYDWSRLPRMCMPYSPSADDYQKKGRLPILILPISQSIFGVTMSPEIIPLIGLPWLQACFREYASLQMPLFHICLHSPCMTDPYFIEGMRGLLRFISQQDISYKYASEIREYNEKRPNASVLPYLSGINRNMVNGLFRRIGDTHGHSSPLAGADHAGNR